MRDGAASGKEWWSLSAMNKVDMTDALRQSLKPFRRPLWKARKKWTGLHGHNC